MLKRVILLLTWMLPLAAFSASNDTYLQSVPDIPAANVGIYIENIRTGEVVMDVNGEIPLIPASVTKAITSATVLSTSSPDDCFKTEITADGPIKNGVLNGNIVVYATGDPTIESAYFPEYSGVADSVASALCRMGVKEVSGQVLVSFPPVLEERVPDGWMSEDLMWPYGAAHHALNYADNKFVLSMPSKRCQPEIPGLKISFVPSRKTTKVEIANKKITVTGRKNRTSSTALSNPDPEASMLKAIEQTIAKRGVVIVGKSLNPSGYRKLIYSHHSPKYIDILNSLMFRSDNMMTEGMLRTIATGGSRRDAIAKELALWANNGVDTCGIVIEDGSGLSRNNRISPYFLADVLVWMIRNNNADNRYLKCFPRAGQDGTMRNFLKDTPLDGRLATKTGSMRNVQCYAGYMLGDDEAPSHVVVIMLNGFTSSRSAVKKAIGNLLIERLSGAS